MVEVIFKKPNKEEEVLQCFFSLNDAETFVAGLIERYPEKYGEEGQYLAYVLF